MYTLIILYGLLASFNPRAFAPCRETNVVDRHIFILQVVECNLRKWHIWFH